MLVAGEVAIAGTSLGTVLVGADELSIALSVLKEVAGIAHLGAGDHGSLFPSGVALEGAGIPHLGSWGQSECGPSYHSA